tara:strand:- start:2554 stop:3381 length:828 start_codon:yes stop_codon:yes gene_type:complete
MDNSIQNLFLKSKDFSIKLEKYFDVYEEYFSTFKGKNITFVEIGVFNGGSLKIWKDYFGPKSRIIGIDINPECKKFANDGIEIHIGNQSDPLFWENFFKEVGNVDIILDDGGHTNLDQIITTVKCVDKINDGGILMVEDTHTSYIDEYNSKNSFSFINFAKKLIDDVNHTAGINEFEKKNDSFFFKFSLNKYIYSTHFYESIVVFRINKKKTFKNKLVRNEGLDHKIEDLTWAGNSMHVENFKKFTNNLKFISFRKITKQLKKRIHNKILKFFFD